MSQTRLSMFPNVPVKGTQLGFAVKSCQNVQIYPYFYFLFFFKKILSIHSGIAIHLPKGIVILME